MAERVWEVTKVCYCEHVKDDVTLESEVLHPIDFLPDSPRVVAHRCSHAVQCNQMDKAACIWAATNPEYDPFRH